MTLIERMGLETPILQAPMAGVSTPAMAAAVSNAGALGAIGIGASVVEAAREMIEAVRRQTPRAFNANLFVHADPVSDPVAETAWLDALAPAFAAFEAERPQSLRTIYRSFAHDDAMLAMLLDTRPPVVSFHFGLPENERVRALKQAGCVLLATATRLDEALACKAAGMDAVVAQGWEAGGHRGAFDPHAEDDRLGTVALTRLLIVRSGLPVIAAGGIMDGAGIRAALDLGAVAAQLGTAFIACPESSADAAFRAALASDAASHTVMTRAISGRPARCLANRFTALAESLDAQIPAYPIAYDAGKALNAAAKAKGEGGFGAQWAGQGAPLACSLPAADLIGVLRREADLS